MNKQKSQKKVINTEIKGDSASLADLATNMLRNKILDLSLAPSEHLEDRILLEKFSFGRTPLREALNRLMSEGLVETKNGRGAYVASMGIWHTLQLLEAYEINERVVASLIKFEDNGLIKDLINIQLNFEKLSKNLDLLGITEINSKFHNRLAKSTGNKFIFDQSAHLHNLVRRLSYFVYRSEQVSTLEISSQLPLINNHHHKIIKFIQKIDRKHLMKVMNEHTNLFRKRLSKIIEGKMDSELNFPTIERHS